MIINLTFAGLDALVPRVVKLCPAVGEPSAARSTATDLAALREAAAHRTGPIDFWLGHYGIMVYGLWLGFRVQGLGIGFRG